MPINELEEHPYLNYYKEFGQVPSDYYKGIIISSFPIYPITLTTCYQQAMLYGNLHFDGSNPII